MGNLYIAKLIISYNQYRVIADLLSNRILANSIISFHVSRHVLLSTLEMFLLIPNCPNTK